MKNAPVQLAEIGLDPHAFHYSDEKSFRGPCPNCGGHRRFVVFTDNDWPLYHGYCDECGTKIRAWERVRTQYDPQRAAAMQAQMIREQAERDEQRRIKLAEFTTKELWEELSERMTLEHIDWWESQGIPYDIQKWLRIGYKADKTYIDSDGEKQHSPAYTIPWFGPNFTFKTMQYRLISPVKPADDRYRFEYGLEGGGSHYYMADPSEPIGDKVIICEGAKKAIVTWVWLAPADTKFTIIAASSNNTLRPALEATKDCGLRYLILDPGSERRAFEVARKEKNLKAVYLPGKVDDLYLERLINRTSFTDILGAI